MVIFQKGQKIEIYEKADDQQWESYMDGLSTA
jgi:hypothetical protein